MKTRTRLLLPALLLVATSACGGGDSSGDGGFSNGSQNVHLNAARAVWLDANTIVWPGANAARTYKLFYAGNAGLAGSSDGTSGADNGLGDALTVTTLSSDLQNRFPQFASATALSVPAALSAQIRQVLAAQIAVVQFNGTAPSDGTQVQTGPVLDSVYGAAASALSPGLSFSVGADVPTFRLWAPTAKSVTLNIFANAAASTSTPHTMTLDAASGMWSFTASDAAWTNTAYYTFTVSVFTRAATRTGSAFGAVVSNEVTDPYSVSLNANSHRSMVLNPADGVTQPGGWPGTLIPTAAVATDSVIYELHVRDFSSNDPTVPGAHVGKYLAFTDTGSDGMTHLAALATAGLTHVHLLPAFDIASVDEVTCTTPAIAPSTGAGTAAGTAVKTTQGSDCFNWGYDPLHYGAPEGSYATDASDGLVRVLEFRRMVQALHGIGLRVIMDVVYNHTSANGQSATAVLDRIVPGYYHRLNASGAVETHSCCSDTATERTMMEKLMTDTLLRWSSFYKIDGFRFDVMGMIPKGAMTRALAAVDANAASDARGHTYFYGEGWTPDAEVSAVITPASQANLGGTGIGTFNDRLRDGVRGGAPFDTGASISANQGFINGLCYDPNDVAANPVCTGGSNDTAFLIQDRIRVGLAGNLANFPLRAGQTGALVDYFGSPTGYTQTPTENLAYVSVHDNETLFDISEYKHPAATSAATAARAQVVGLSLAVLAQGVPLIHAGDDLLRSKSGDSNSYNSADYFNRIDWSGATSNWSTGLPPDNTGNNAANSATLAALLTSRPAPDQAAMLATSAAFRALLTVRKQTDLFRLTSASAINSCVSFPDVANQVHGLIVERILGVGCVSGTTSGYRSVVVLFNASNAAQSFPVAAYADKTQGTGAGQISLHPAQLAGGDAVQTGGWGFAANGTAGTFTVPARTTAVFVEYP